MSGRERYWRCFQIERTNITGELTEYLGYPSEKDQKGFLRDCKLHFLT